MGAQCFGGLKKNLGLLHVLTYGDNLFGTELEYQMEYFYPKFLWKSNVSNMKIPEQSIIDNMCLQSQHSQGRWENHKSEPSLGYKANILKKKKAKRKRKKKNKYEKDEKEE